MEHTTMALKTMPIAKLQDLKSKIDEAINAKVSERRRELEAELSELSAFAGRGAKAIKFGRGGGGVSSHLNTAIPTTQMRPGLVEVSGRGGSLPQLKAVRALRILPSSGQAQRPPSQAGDPARPKGRQRNRAKISGSLWPA
jgi:hypothetical protein